MKQGLAFASVVINVLLAMFYNTIIAWAVYYLYLSFAWVVPWRDCNNPWNTECCFPLNQINDFEFSKNSIDSYYNITQKGLLYRNTPKKLILFKSHNESATFDDIRSILNLPFLNTSSLNSSSNVSYDLHSIGTWFQSYLVLTDFEQLTEIPALALNSSIKEIIKFDTDVGPKFIDSHINSIYANTNFTVIMNCSKFMTSPTQEFYFRYLTEMHRARGLEHIGGIKWEIALSLFFVFLTVYFALWKGIKSAGKVAVEQ